MGGRRPQRDISEANVVVAEERGGGWRWRERGGGLGSGDEIRRERTNDGRNKPSQAAAAAAAKPLFQAKGRSRPSYAAQGGVEEKKGTERPCTGRQAGRLAAELGRREGPAVSSTSRDGRERARAKYLLPASLLAWSV